MRSERTERIEKAVFLVSLLVLVFLYGYASRHFGWFPDDFLQRAWLQARVRGTHSLPANLVGSMGARVYDGEGAEVEDRAAMQPGLTLVASLWNTTGEWKPGLHLIDADGKALHTWLVDVDQLLTDSDSVRQSLDAARSRSVHGTYLFPDGTVLANIDYVGTVKLDACGRLEWRLMVGNHHSIAPAEDGSFWIPGSTALRPSNHPYPSGPSYRDLLLRVSADGRVLDRIDVLDLLYDNDLQDYLVKADYSDPRDPIHLNDIEPLPDSLAGGYPLFEAGDLLVSLRNPNLVMVVDPSSHHVEWHTADPFLAQHDPDFIGDGWIGVFDNRRDNTLQGTLLGGTRIVAVRPRTGEQRALYPTARSEPFYTGQMGKWQQLANGDLLLTEARAGRVLEVTTEGRTVWRWLAPPYNEFYVPEVSEATRYDLTPEDVAAWPCAPDHPDGSASS